MTARLRWTTLVALILASTRPAGQAPTSAPPAQSDQGVTFRVEVNYVEVDARAVDGQGNFVRTLKQEDFQIIEDGKPQAVSTFALVDIPVEKHEAPLYSRNPIEADVATNAQPFDGRVYLFVLDTLHIRADNTQRTRNLVKRFIQTRIAANDLAAIITIHGGSSGGSGGAQGFTNKPRLLLQVVDRLIGEKKASETEARLARIDPITGAPADTDPLDFERGLDADVTLRTLGEAADFLSGIHGRRKSIVFVSEGIGYNVFDFSDRHRQSGRLQATAQNVIALTSRNNISIYSIDPRGLTTPGDGDEINLTSQVASDTELGLRSLSREMQLENDSMRVLADAAGGFAAVNTNDFEKVFDRIVRENSSYYLLGYYPSSSRRDGKNRKIDVKVRQPGVQVIARKAYTEPSGKATTPALVTTGSATSQNMVSLLNGRLPVSGLTLAATAAAFKGASNASVKIAIEARGRDLNLKEENGKYTGGLEFSVWAFDKDGKFSAGERPNARFDLRPETFQRVNKFGAVVVTRLNLAPGRYQLRIGAVRGETGALGSVFYDLEVPNFLGEPLTMSGVLLSSIASSQAFPLNSDPELANLLPAAPTAQREFPVGDSLALFVEVYDNQVSPAHTVDLTTSVLTDEGRTVFSNSEERFSEELEGKPGGYGYQAKIPLQGLPPGLYVLRLEARSRLQKKDPVVREVQFRIVG